VELARELLSVSARLGEARAADYAAKAASALAGAIAKNTVSLYDLSRLTVALGLVSPRLSKARAATCASRAADALVAAMAKADATALASLGRGLAAVRAHLDEAGVSRAAGGLADTLAKSGRASDRQHWARLPGLAQALVSVSGLLGEARAEAYAAQAAEDLAAASPRPFTGDALAYRALALGRLLPHVAEARAAEYAGKAADDLVAAMAETDVVAVLSNLAGGLAAVSARLDRPGAARAAGALLDAMKNRPPALRP
jgi:hypothetical protein